MPDDKTSIKYYVVSIKNIFKKNTYYVLHTTRFSKSRKGFTMIELLISISIMAILVGIGTYSYTNAQIKSRDTRRKQDLAQVKAAMTLYFEDNKEYSPKLADPLGSSGNTCGLEATTQMTFCPSSTGGTWIPNVTNYIQTLPKDPSQ